MSIIKNQKNTHNTSYDVEAVFQTFLKTQEIWSDVLGVTFQIVIIYYDI